jgi:alkylhydroperoxidase family enzyme
LINVAGCLKTIRTLFFAAGYTQAQLFEVILGISYKTLSNYVNHIADAPLDNAFFAGKWAPVETRLAS